MKVMINADRIVVIGNEIFEETIKTLQAHVADIRIVCRGLKGREGDSYDYLRKAGMFPVIFTEGLDPAFYLAKEGWVPDVIMSVPCNYDMGKFFHNAEILL